ncbi:hypothetical protein [Microbacterium sp. NPDC087589]|uniref:hypothetical protein n=1 Tax=Microbacterium sp. NPDC087589 TaxID=3364191 RepID=UPI003804E9B1
MARPEARSVRGALSFLDLRGVPDAPEDFVDAWVANKRPTDLIRSHLEVKSSFGFVDDIRAALEEALTEAGPGKDLADLLLPQLLTAPGFSSQKADGEHTLVRQAVLFERPTENDFEILVTVDVRLTPWQRIPDSRDRLPAAAACVAVACDLFDMTDDIDLGRVMTEHMRMLRDFPETRQNPRSAATSVTVLGDLTAIGADSAPDTWRSDIELLAHAFDVKPSFRREPTFTGTVSDSTAHVIRFEPYEGIAPLTHDGKEISSTEIQARTLTYDEIFHAVAVAFADLEEAAATDPYAPRALTAGQKVFHRKVGNSRKFDQFDKGSDSPCKHNSFVVWNKSPKAAKGFHRRYTNFQDGWLRHCARGMNCGMYAVFAPDNI